MTAADFHAARERLARLNIERQFATGAMREHWTTPPRSYSGSLTRWPKGWCRTLSMQTIEGGMVSTEKQGCRKTRRNVMTVMINGVEYKTNTFGLLRADLHAEYELLNRTATPVNKARRLELEQMAKPILAGRCIDCDEPAQVYIVNGKRIRVGCKC